MVIPPFCQASCFWMMKCVARPKNFVVLSQLLYFFCWEISALVRRNVVMGAMMISKCVDGGVCKRQIHIQNVFISGRQIFASFFLEGDQGNQPKVIRLASWSTRAHCWLLLLRSWEFSNGGSKICLGGPLHNQVGAAIDTLKTSLWRKHWKRKKHRESTGGKGLTVIWHPQNVILSTLSLRASAVVLFCGYSHGIQIFRGASLMAQW